MPLYEYRCDACGRLFELIRKFSDPPLETCPHCGGAVRKLFSSPAIQFKGSGFYITDYAKKDESTAKKDDSAATPSDSRSEPASKDKDTGEKSGGGEKSGEKGHKAGKREKSDKGERSDKSEKAAKDDKTSAKPDAAPAASTKPTS
jgi:putative FmdB family regulatory protein